MNKKFALLAALVSALAGGAIWRVKKTDRPLLTSAE